MDCSLRIVSILTHARGRIGLPRRAALLPALFAFVVMLGVLSPSEAYGDDKPLERLGSVSFPISCASGSQAPFERGVALLHSFWHDEAEHQFQQIEQQDPECAMAYWGEAMGVHYQLLWLHWSEAAMQRGQALVERAQKAQKASAREREYIAALLDFFETPAGATVDARSLRYSNAMEQLHSAYPDDREATAFYALSLLESASGSDLTLTNQRKALAILDREFKKAPDHPGLAHYIIHAADTPELAPLGLAAARKYAAIAPSSPHALHMPGHIFARLGLWQEDIQSNLASLAAARAPSPVHIGAENQVHAMEFLQYAYLQMGEDQKASELVKQVSSIRQADVDPALVDYMNYARTHFPAIQHLEQHDWKAALEDKPPADAQPVNVATTYWAHAVAAGHLHDAAGAQQAASAYRAQLEAERAMHPTRVSGMKPYLDEADAWAAFAAGDEAAALQMMRAVADRQDKFGKKEVDLPAREMAADMLLLAKRPAEALVEYKRALASDPNRLNELAGALRAAETSGDHAEAEQYKQQLLKNCVAQSKRCAIAADATREY